MREEADSGLFKDFGGLLKVEIINYKIKLIIINLFINIIVDKNGLVIDFELPGN